MQPKLKVDRETFSEKMATIDQILLSMGIENYVMAVDACQHGTACMAKGESAFVAAGISRLALLTEELTDVGALTVLEAAKLATIAAQGEEQKSIASDNPYFKAASGQEC